MSLISLGSRISNKIFLPILCSITFNIFYFFPYQKTDFKYQLFIIIPFSQLFLGIINIIRIKRSKKVLFKKNWKYKNQTKLKNWKKIMFLSLIISILSLITLLFDIFFNEIICEKDNYYFQDYIDYGYLGIIILTFMYYIRGNKQLGTHQKISIILSIIILIIQNIICYLNYNSFEFSKSLDLLILISLKSIKEFLINYQMITLNLSQYALLFINGILHLIYFLILTVILLIIDLHFFNYFFEYNNYLKDIPLIIISVILYSLFLVFNININYYISPISCMSIYIIHYFFNIISLIFFYEKVFFMSDKIYILVIFLSMIIVIFTLIQNEIIVLNFWGLNIDTMEKIDERGDLEFLESNKIIKESLISSFDNYSISNNPSLNDSQLNLN